MHAPTDFLFIKTATIYPPIEYAYLAPHVTKLGLSVSIIDRIVGEINEAELRRILLEAKPRYVGIKCLSFAANLSFDTARIVKEVLPGCIVIFGGHHVTALPKETLQNRWVDIIVRGEGEYTIAELVDALEKKLPLDGIRGIGFKVDGRLVMNEDRPFIQNLDDLPLPAYDLIDIDRYFHFSAMHGMRIRYPRFMPIFTSRGCPYHCIYCHHQQGYKVRTKSPARIAEEVSLLIKKFGVREFHIEDDTFNFDVARAKQVMDRLIALNRKIYLQFPSGLRADKMDNELAAKMKKAGAFMACVAVETGSPRIMGLIKKKLDLSKVKGTIDALVRNRILTWGYFMLGFPTETREEMRQTVRFAKSLKCHFASFSITIPFPGTPLWDSIDTGGIAMDDYCRDLSFWMPKITLSQVPAEELPEVKRKAIREFFSIWRILRIATYITCMADARYYWKKFTQRKIGAGLSRILRKLHAV